MSVTHESINISSKALRYKLTSFFVKALSKRLQKLTKVTKQLITIIIVSFEFRVSITLMLIAKMRIKTCYFRLFC